MTGTDDTKVKSDEAMARIAAATTDAEAETIVADMAAGSAEINKRSAFTAGLRDIADFYDTHPEFPMPYAPRFAVSAGGADTFAGAARDLGGRRSKRSNDDLMYVGRMFGPVEVEVMISRAKVCERRVVDTVTEVVTALACVHCGQPIVMTEAMVWRHAPNDDGRLYEGCDGTTSYDGMPAYDVGNVATAPDFTAVSTTTTEVVEWDCKPVLGDDEARS